VTERGAPNAARRASVRTTLVATLVLAATGTASFLLAEHADRTLERAPQLEEMSYYPSGTWLRQAALGDAIAWADLLWLRAVQYYGLHRQSDNSFTKLAHVFDIITTLDPSFRAAYVFGGHSLCQEAQQFGAGVELLEKGQRANPKDWIYPFELGFVHYVGKKDLTRATFEFAQASREPGAPPYCQRFAAWSGQRAGYEFVALELWREVAETTRNLHSRENAVKQIRKLVRGTSAETQIELWIRGLPKLEGDADRPVRAMDEAGS
jgi:hypothetical protein